jgi:LemA protein
LIGNILNTVQVVADFERGTLVEVIEAGAKATFANIDPSSTIPAPLA